MASPHPEVLRLARGESVRVSLDAEAFVRSAFEHRLGGLLWTAIEAGEIEQLPTTLHQRAAIADLRVAAHHHALWDGLVRLEDELRSIGVTPVSLKGVTSEARWYDRIGERPCSDIDIWLRPDDHTRLDAVLDMFQLASDVKKMILRLVDRRQLQHVDVLWGGVSVDLHFDPMKLGIWTRSADEILERCVFLDGVKGCRSTVLSAEDALVLFLLHLNKDRFAYLGAAGDVKRVMEREELDWDTIHRLVSAEGLDVPVYQSLAAVAAVLGMDIPSMARVTGLRGELWTRLWPEKSRFRGHEGRMAHPRRQVLIPGLARHRGADAFKEWRRQLLPSKELLVVQGVAVSNGPMRALTIDRWNRRRARGDKRVSRQ